MVVANCEAVNCLRNAGVPEEQLFPVQGGERLPLFTKETRLEAKRNEVPLASFPPGRPPYPHHSLAALSVHVWPSLHCFMPHPVPTIMDTAVSYEDEDPFASTLEITFGMKYGLLRIDQILPPEQMDDGLRSFCGYVSQRDKHVFSHCDGGQLMFNIIIDDKSILWSAHLGGYEGILKSIEPKPSMAILAIAGRANHNGRPFVGSAAQYITQKIQWLGEPKQVIWCLHDQRYKVSSAQSATSQLLESEANICFSCMSPLHVDTAAAEKLVEQETNSKILSLKPAELVILQL